MRACSPLAYRRLLAQYPELHIELLLLPRSPSLAAREADLTVTLEPPRSGRYYVTRLTQLRYDLYADRPSTWPSIGRLSSGPILTGHRFVDYVQDYLLSDSLRYLDELGLDPQRVFAATGMQAQYEAIRCGLGIGMLARYLVSRKARWFACCPPKCGSSACYGWQRRPTCLRGVACEWFGISCVASSQRSRSSSAQAIARSLAAHLPIQKRLKIAPSKSSADISPVISPIELPASRSSSANKSSCESVCAA